MFSTFITFLGLFNVCDKVISLDILLEFREYFKKGHPIGNVISSKLSVLRMKCREEFYPTDNQLGYIMDLLYNAFFCFEIISECSLYDVVCGICGICPEIYLGDGNEKNCCSNAQVHFTKKNEPKKPMINLDDFLKKLRLRWLERVVYTRVENKFCA
ncbi:HMG box domain containing 3 [Porites harrisoni]